MSIKMERDHNLSEMLQKRQQELYLKETDIDNGPSRGGQNTTDAFNEESETAPLLAKTRWLTKSVTTQRANNSQGQKFTRKNTKLGEKRTMESQQYINSQTGKMFKKNKPFFQSRVELKLGDIVYKKTERTTFARNETTCKTDPNFDKLSKPSYGFNSVVQSSKCLAPNEGTSNEYKANKLSRVIAPEAKRCYRDDLSNNCQLVGASNKTLKQQFVGSHSAEEQRPLAKDKTKSDKKHLEKQKRYSEMTMSGWILDSIGKWIKDENVEFDSDDEEPT